MIPSSAMTVLSLVLAYFMWSTGLVIIKASLPWMGWLTVMTLRMVPPFIVYLCLWKKVQPAAWRREDFKWLALMVLCDPLGTLFFQTHALPLTTASQSGMIFACMPLLMAGMARVLFKEKIRRRCLYGIISAFFGVCMVALTGHASAQAPNPLLGNFLSFCAVCSLLTYSLTVKKLAGRYKPYTLLFVQAMGANAIQIPMFLLFFPERETLQAVPGHIWLAVAYMGCFPACIGYFLINRGISLIKAAYVSLLNSLVPVFVLILSYILLGERLLPLQYLGSALVLTGAVLAGIPEESEP